jgi:hypothetical protein
MLPYCEKLRTMITLCPSYPYATILSFTARIERAHSDRASDRFHSTTLAARQPRIASCARRVRPFRGRALREHRAILGCLVAHFLSFIARSTSRLASRVLMDSRRSCCFLPLANPSSTLARPRLEK